MEGQAADLAFCFLRTARRCLWPSSYQLQVSGGAWRRDADRLAVKFLRFSTGVDNLAAATTLPWLWLKELDTQWQNWLANLYAVLVFLGGAQLLTGKRVRAEIEDLAWDPSMVGEYLDNEYKREEILSEIDNALEAIAESSTGYRRVILLAYSFGSVVALEATLARADVAPRVRKHVKTLVTIGCPYDFVTTYWPDFFRFSPRWSTEWINAYTEADVLGSRFGRSRKGEQVVVPDIEFEFPEARKVPPKLSRLMSLRGFFVHALLVAGVSRPACGVQSNRPRDVSSGFAVARHRAA